jgi:hypothetical protein
MMERKEIILHVLLIICVSIFFFIIPWTSVFGIKYQDFPEAIFVFYLTGIVIITLIVIKIAELFFKQSLAQKRDEEIEEMGKIFAQEMEEEEIKEAGLKNTKQVLFKPTIGVLIVFLLFTAGPLLIEIHQFMKNRMDPDSFIPGLMMFGFFIFMWYITPVFIFGEDSVQIKSFLFYCFRIDWKTVIKYADITAVKPAPEGEAVEEIRRHRIEIFANGKRKKNFLIFYNSDVVAKIYLRFKEKLGDKVRFN